MQSALEDTWDLSAFDSMLFLGRQGQGKTHLMTSFFVRYGHLYDLVDLYCPSTFDYDMSKFTTHPGLTVHEEPNCDELMEQVESALATRRTGAKVSSLVILDDFIGYMPARHAVWRLLASQSRHAYMTVIYLSQALSDSFSFLLRDACQHWFVCGSNAPSENDVKKYEVFFPPESRYVGRTRQLRADWTRVMGPKPFSFFYIRRKGHDSDTYFCRPIKHGRFTIRPLPAPRNDREERQSYLARLYSARLTQARR